MPTALDRFWIFTCVAGSDNEHLIPHGYPQGSRMTPAEGAFFLEVPNLQLVRWQGQPAPAEFDQYALAFTPLERVVWSIGCGNAREGEDEVGQVLELAGRYPNITGVIVDDFYSYNEAGVYTATELEAIRARLASAPRPLDLWAVLYTHQFDKPVRQHLDLFDVISLWTWNSDHLVDLERNLDTLEGMLPGKPLALGLYLWDYHNARPLTVDQMERQCSLGLEWLQSGRIEAMVFLGNTVADLGFESVSFARDWIRAFGATPL